KHNWQRAFEICDLAELSTKNLLRHFMDTGDLAHALHLLQDQWPVGHHGFKPWDGPYHWPPGTGPVQHAMGDVFPGTDAVANAFGSTREYLYDLLHNNLNDPTEYVDSSCR